MDSDEDYSLTNVVRHVKYFLQKLEPKQNLTLEYKFAKTAQSVEGNKKFQRILESSHEDIIVMNTDREINRNNYVHLKSMTYLDEYHWFLDNLKTLQTMLEIKVYKKNKVDLNVAQQKVSFDCQSLSWAYKNRRHLFRPCYEAVRNGKLFRISLVRQMNGNNTPNKKITDMIQKTKKRTMKQEKQQPYNGKFSGGKKVQAKKSESIPSKQSQKSETHYDPRHDGDSPFRFKIEETYHLNKCCSLVMCAVYQVKNVQLYEQMCSYIKQEMLIPHIVADKCKTIIQNMKDQLAYEVEFRFNPDFIREFTDLQDEEIEKIMKSGAQILLTLSKDPVEFSADEIVNHLNTIDGK